MPSQDAQTSTAAPVTLRASVPSDRRRIFEWLAQSDATASMMGPPQYPELPVTTWDGFCKEYGDHYFDGSEPLAGCCYIIEAGGRDIGVICHNQVDPERASTDMDIWLHSRDDCGKGYGPAALKALMGKLARELGVRNYIIYTSRRNPRAIAAYLKTGFREISRDEAAGIVDIKEEDLDYKDGVFLYRGWN